MRKQVAVSFDPNAIVDWISKLTFLGHGVEGHAIMQFNGPTLRPRVYKSMGMISKTSIPHLDSILPGCLFVAVVSVAPSAYMKRTHISDIFPNNTLEDVNDDAINAYFTGDILKFELSKPHYLSPVALSSGGGRIKDGVGNDKDVIVVDFKNKAIRSAMIVGTWETTPTFQEGN